MPRKQPKRGRLWRNDGSCVRLRPTHRNHVWAYDFMAARTHNGRPFRILTILDEHTREGLAIKVARRIRSDDVLESLLDLFVAHGVPDYIRADNGPEFTAKAVRDWLARVGAQTLFIEPGSTWENGYVESFNGKLRDELLDREIFYTLKEAQVLIEDWRMFYNQVRPHSVLGYRPPAPVAIRPAPERLRSVRSTLNAQRKAGNHPGTNIASGTSIGGRPLVRVPAGGGWAVESWRQAAT